MEYVYHVCRPGEYYVGETVQDDCAMSETTEGTTVESTHPGMLFRCIFVLNLLVAVSYGHI